MKKDSGYLVVTKSGRYGRTYHKEGLTNGKALVYCNDGSKLLCDPDTLTINGFID